METIKDKIVKTRKNHTCLCCCKTIEKGTPTRTQTNKDDGQIWTVRFCDDCTYLTRKYFDIFNEDQILLEGCVKDKFQDYGVANAAELRKELDCNN
jgi:hypothetical protein